MNSLTLPVADGVRGVRKVLGGEHPRGTGR